MAKKDMRHKIIGSRKRALSRYSMILHRVKNTHLSRNHGYRGVRVIVTKDEFVEWFMSRDFEGCSVDRIDNSGHYELSNMQVIPLAENMGKDSRKHIDGVCVCFSCGEEKKSEEFAVNIKSYSGRTTICRRCDSSRVKNVSPEARERSLLRMKEYYRRVTKPKKQQERMEKAADAGL